MRKKILLPTAMLLSLLSTHVSALTINDYNSLKNMERSGDQDEMSQAQLALDSYLEGMAQGHLAGIVNEQLVNETTVGYTKSVCLPGKVIPDKYFAQNAIDTFLARNTYPGNTGIPLIYAAAVMALYPCK